MRSNRHLVGKRIAQALIALVLTLIVVQGALAADTCQCPSCPAHACMHMGCPNGDDASGCATATSDACRDGVVMPFVSATKSALALHYVTIIAAARTLVRPADWNIGTVRHALVSPPIAAPPAHIAFCRLRR